MAGQRLSKSDWITAGFNALATSGYGALQAEAIARDLETTKGSFYWHFKGLKDYKLSLLESWRVIRAEDIITQLSEIEPGFARVYAIIEMAKGVDSQDTPIQAENAIREWARYDHDAAKVVSEVDNIRVAFLSEQFGIMGVTDTRYARALYVAYVGVRTLPASLGCSPGQDLKLILDCLILGADNQPQVTDSSKSVGDKAVKNKS